MKKGQNKNHWTLAAAAVSLISLSSGAFAEGRAVDVGASEVQWTGSKLIGSSHTGTLKFLEGEVTYHNGAPVAAHLVVDIASLANKDLTDPDMNKKLVGHLLSEDFFDAGRFPKAELKVSEFRSTAPHVYELKGQMTIKDQTQPITLIAKEQVTSASAKGPQLYEVQFKFDRTAYGLRYGSNKFFTNLGDKVISDEVDLKVKLQVGSANAQGLMGGK